MRSPGRAADRLLLAGLVAAVLAGCGGGNAHPGGRLSLSNSGGPVRLPVFTARIQTEGDVVVRGGWTSVAAVAPGTTCASLAARGTGPDSKRRAIFAVPDVPRTDQDLAAGRNGSVGGGHTLRISIFADPYHGPDTYAGSARLGENGLVLDAPARDAVHGHYDTLAGDDIRLTVHADGSGAFHVSGLSVGQTGAPLRLDITWTCAETNLPG